MKNDELISAAGLEKHIYEIDGARVTIHAPKSKKFKPYSCKKQASDNMSISAWKRNRLEKYIDDATLEIRDGNGDSPHGRTLLKKVRCSY